MATYLDPGLPAASVVPEPEPIADPPASVASAGPSRFINRELSWLDFNERVLVLADDHTQPLLERAKFLSIFNTNLDEFFQVRVAGLKDQLAAGLPATARDGMSPLDQLRAIRERVIEQLARQSAVFLDRVAPAPAEAGIPLSELSSPDHA